MKLYIDTDSDNYPFRENAIFNSPVSEVSFKRGDSASVEIIFVSNNTALSATADKLLTFGIKEKGKYDSDYIVSTSEYNTLGTSYVLNPSFNTVGINDLLNSGDGNEDNDIASISGMLEVTWSSDGGANWASSNTITAVINNDVCKGGEATSEPSQTLTEWLALYHPAPLVLSAAPLSGTSAAFAIANINFISNAANNDAVNIAGQTYIFKDSPALAYDVQIGANKDLTAFNCISAFQGLDGRSPTISTVFYTGSSFGPVLNFRALAAGTSGNTLTLSSNNFNIFAIPFVGGVNAVTGTLGKLGQDAIVNTLSCYKCTQETPVKWVRI